MQTVALSHALAVSGVRLPHMKRCAEPPLEGLLALLATDLEGFTPLVERLGDDAARELMHQHNRIVRGALHAHGGREIAHTGDGIMAAFRSVAAALETAIAVQRGLLAHAALGIDAPLRVRVGVHVGEPLPEEGRLFGACVNTCVRVCAVAPVQGVLVTDLARQLVGGRRYRFAQSRTVALKGIARPAHVHELLWSADEQPSGDRVSSVQSSNAKREATSTEQPHG